MPLALVIGGVLALGVGLWLARPESAAGDAFVPWRLPDVSARVQHRERAAGVHPELIELLDAWEIEGTHDVTVAEDGGVRVGPDAEAQQLSFFVGGLSKARTLRETPHGRGAALDVHPVGFNPHAGFETQPGMREKFVAFGTWAESKGFTWGGRFGGFGKDGDMPHVELKAWTALPFPAPDNGRYT